MSVALFSVSNKDGLIPFADGLCKLGWQLLASGGTARVLGGAGLPVQEIADYTNSPEILGGRVKTLHPAVHGGILARATQEDKDDLDRIHATYVDLVVVNLYPFKETINKPDVTLADAVENIDIGGVALIRAAAKNHERVTVICDPDDYASVLEEIQLAGNTSPESRLNLAQKAFMHTSQYDTAIAEYLNKQTNPDEKYPDWLAPFPRTDLRYGENPHQKSSLFHFTETADPLGGVFVQGKALSYNNILDLDAAWRAVVMFSKPSIVIVKHLSPCGIASDDSLVRAFEHALASDPVSAFGGVIAANQPFDGETAKALGGLFVECIIAPGFTNEAKTILAERKNCRLIEMPGIGISPDYEVRSVNEGILWQTRDVGDPGDPGNWKVVSERQPSQVEWDSLKFAWKACQHVRSNAIVFAQGEATVGIGGGQPNRVDCVKIAAERAKEKSTGAVMASDAFFPFADSVEEAAKAGITAIIEPGGSLRDEESIAAANKHGMAMVFTGTRHFRH